MQDARGHKRQQGTRRPASAAEALTENRVDSRCCPVSRSRARLVPYRRSLLQRGTQANIFVLRGQEPCGVRFSAEGPVITTRRSSAPHCSGLHKERADRRSTLVDARSPRLRIVPPFSGIVYSHPGRSALFPQALKRIESCRTAGGQQCRKQSNSQHGNRTCKQTDRIQRGHLVQQAHYDAC